jgi:hypothetical protein
MVQLQTGRNPLLGKTAIARSQRGGTDGKSVSSSQRAGLPYWTEGGLLESSARRVRTF